MRLHKQKAKDKAVMKHCQNRIADTERNLKIKPLNDFDHSVACSIKSLVVIKIPNEDQLEVYEQKKANVC